MSQNLSSAAVVIGALRVKKKMIYLLLQTQLMSVYTITAMVAMETATGTKVSGK